MQNRRNPFSRRNFVGGLGASALAAPVALTQQHALAMQDHDTPASDDDMTVEEMDEMHRVSHQSFPAPTEGVGNQELEHTMDGDVKVFELETSVFQWEYAPGEYAEAWGYNGAVPGPVIRVTEDDTVRIHVTNSLPESTSIHWHGLVLPVRMEGIPFITQAPIKPGETFTYGFPIRAGNTGSHMYHSHYNSAFQVTHGLLGAFIVEPADKTVDPEFDKEYIMILNDGPIGQFTINGKGFPGTEALTAKQGEKLRIRFMNEGLMIHPMHLHGMPMLVTHNDGYKLDTPYMCDTLNIAPGERYDVIVDATEQGTWLFHCHILSHAESPHGMFGMATALVVD
jgi:FtsP/CotA-like multicopper oxidase with cupredoxin domain